MLQITSHTRGSGLRTPRWRSRSESEVGHLFRLLRSYRRRHGTDRRRPQRYSWARRTGDSALVCCCSWLRHVRLCNRQPVLPHGPRPAPAQADASGAHCHLRHRLHARAHHRDAGFPALDATAAGLHSLNARSETADGPRLPPRARSAAVHPPARPLRDRHTDASAAGRAARPALARAALARRGTQCFRRSRCSEQADSAPDWLLLVLNRAVARAHGLLPLCLRRRGARQRPRNPSSDMARQGGRREGASADRGRRLLPRVRDHRRCRARLGHRRRRRRRRATRAQHARRGVPCKHARARRRRERGAQRQAGSFTGRRRGVAKSPCSRHSHLARNDHVSFLTAA
mmetsp:Transcript_13202/g.28104  ORF Transcript_13202/g.28104 Transcript_13202/m.28104 type:complete len:344 (-) Transcript_13202:46-1077(-)